MALVVSRNARQRAHYHRLAETLRELEFHLHGRLEGSGQLPPEWDEIARQQGAMPKVKVTFWVEGDVVKFFRATGRGFQTRMAEVLAAFVHARLSGIVAGAEGVDYAPKGPGEVRHRIAVLQEYMDLAREAEVGKQKAARPLPENNERPDRQT